MWRCNKILVPVDFSDTSRAAISAALQIAADHDATLTLIHVEEGMDREIRKRIYSAPNDTVIEDTMAFNEQALRDAAHLELQRASDLGEPIPGVQISTEVVGGDWTEVILGWVEDNEIDLVITGTHGRKSGVKGIFSSKSEKLVEKAPCTVMVVKPKGFPYLRD